MGIEASKEERKFLDRIRGIEGKVYLSTEEADQEGFEYFASSEYLNKPGKLKPSLINKLRQTNRSELLEMMKMLVTVMPKMFKGINDGFRDVHDLVSELVNNGSIDRPNHQLLNSFPNEDIWLELVNYAWDKWQVKIGFTRMPDELIFKNKAVLYSYTLVCIQEMDKKEIDKAPQIAAGKEVQRVYASLGVAVNDIANWLRNKYDINCHSNHPLGGLVNTSPLGAKAGMGWQGHNGLLITPEFGQRHRIAPIFIENAFFSYTDSLEHEWIEDFCKGCQKCEKSCPTQAIYSEKIINIKNIDIISMTRTCIDREKCYDYFNKTMGCSVCVKVCPFSQGTGVYNKLKNSYLRRTMNQAN